MVTINAMNQRCDTNGDAYGEPCAHPTGGKGVCLEDGSMIALSSMNQLCDALGEPDRDMEEWETDDEPEPIVPIDEGLAQEKVDEEFRGVIGETRALYAFTSLPMRMRKLKRLQEHKKRLRYQLSLLGIRALRPQDIAWNYVFLYNEKIRKLWVHCNQNDPYEKDRVMRQIDDLNHKRQQLLAEFDEEDCVMPVWYFADGWVPPKYRPALPPLESEIVKQPEPVQQPESVQQPEPVQQPQLVITQAFPDVPSLDRISDSSDSNGNNGISGMDLDHMGLDSQDSHFDVAFEDTTTSQRYDADLSSLDAFEASLWKQADDTVSAYLDAVELERLQEQMEFTMSMEQAPTQFQSEIDENIDSDRHSLFSGTDDDIDSDRHSLFSDTDDDQVDPAPASCQAVEEPQVLENASHALSDQMDSVPVSFQAAEELQIPDNTSKVLPNTEQASFQEQVIEDDDDSLFGAFDEDYQPESTEEMGPAADDSMVSEKNAVADIPAASPQVSQEQLAVEGDIDDDDDDDNDPFDCDFEDVIFETDLSSNQNLNEPQSSPNTCSDTDDARDDARDLVNSEPVAQPEHDPESPLNPGFEAMPTQAFGTPFSQGLEAQFQTADQPVSPGPIAQYDQSPEAPLHPALPTQAFEASLGQGLEAELQAADQPAPEIQAVPDTAPIEQVVLAPHQFQVTAGQSEATGGVGAEAPSISQEIVPRNPFPLPSWHEQRLEMENIQAMHQYAREELCRFWPDNMQPCSNMQLEFYASGSEEFEKQELERYEQCFHTGQDYIVEFVGDYNEIPPNMLLTWIDNGNYAFLCLIDQTPAQYQSQNMSTGVIDLTGADSTSSAATAPLGAQGAILAPPAEIVAAGAPVPAAAGGRFVPETPEAEEEEARNVPKIPTPPPVDEATFAQASASVPVSTEPTTPVQHASDGNNGTWSSGWSGQAFSDGGKSPRTPSTQEINSMAHSVRSDNSDRLTNSTGEAKGRKKARGKASKGAASGSLSSVHSAHNALNHQLSQTAQTPGNVPAPPPTGPGPVTGPSNAIQPIQQQPASQAAKGKRHVGRPHKDDSELVSPRKRQLQHPDSPCAESSEGGNKRRKKNAPAAADATDASQAQQHGTPEESQPTQYYGPSPDRSLDAKAWLEEHQGGKGKRGQKRKAPAPKKTPAPRKARKTKEATPPAPRTYRPIAPAPPPNQDHANAVQMQSRESTPMAPSGTTDPSIDVQMNGNGNGTQMRPAAPHMQNGQPQQMHHQSFQQLPQQQGFRYPASQQSGFNPVQQQNSQYHMDQQDGFTNDKQEEQYQNAVVAADDHLASLRAQVREAEKARSILHQQGQQHGQEYPNLSAQMIPDHFAQQDYQEPMQQHFQLPPQQGSQQPQSFGMISSDPQFRQWMRSEFRDFMASEVSQSPMTMSRMMSNQGMSSNGIAPYRANMPQGYRQDFSAAGFQPARPLPRNGYRAPMNFSQTMQGTNIQGAYGGFDEGVGGAYMAQDEMAYFRG